MIVLHSLPLWLPQTSPWLWNQVRFLPSTVEAHVAAERTAHLDRFPVPRLHRFDDEPAWRRLADRGLRKAGLRPGLGFVERTARAVRADLVHSHWGDAGWRDADGVRRAGARHVVSFYGKDVQFLPRSDARWRDRYRTMFATIDRVLCEGPHFAKAIEALGCPAEKIGVQPLGVDVEAIEARPRRREPSEPLAILVAASFREKKGIPDAIDAAGRLAASGVAATLTLVGDASDDPRSVTEKARILDAIERHRAHLPVRLLGYRTHAELLREAYAHHVFLAPSREAADGDTEGGAPVVLIDVAATAMPIVATRHADIPEIVLDRTTGLLAAEGDVPALAEALARLAAEPALATRLGEAGRSHVERRFDVRVLAGRLADTYAKTVEGR